jgi:hypothetical protein
LPRRRSRRADTSWLQRGQQHTTRHPAEEQQGIDVLAADPHANVNAALRKAVPVDKVGDEVALRDDIAFDEPAPDVLVRRQHSTRVLNRQHESVDNDSAEVNNSVGGSVEVAVLGVVDVYAPVPRSIGRQWLHIGLDDNAWAVDGPLPARSRGRGRGPDTRRQGNCQGHRESSVNTIHPASVKAGLAAGGATTLSVSYR